MSTLKEKFETKSSIDTTKEAKVFARECEQIADNYAINFAERCLNELLDGNKPQAETMDGLLEIFKKENGL